MKTMVRYRLKTFYVDAPAGLEPGVVRIPEDAVPLLSAIYRDGCDADRAHFVVLALDEAGAILGYKILASCARTGCAAEPKEIFRVAFAFPGTKQLVLSHSHTNQDPTPSLKDSAMTRKLVDIGDELGIPLTAHIIIASSGRANVGWHAIRVDDQSGRVGSERTGRVLVGRT